MKRHGTKAEDKPQALTFETCVVAGFAAASIGLIDVAILLGMRDDGYELLNICIDGTSERCQFRQGRRTVAKLLGCRRCWSLRPQRHTKYPVGNEGNGLLDIEEAHLEIVCSS